MVPAVPRLQHNGDTGKLVSHKDSSGPQDFTHLSFRTWVLTPLVHLRV